MDSIPPSHHSNKPSSSSSSFEADDDLDLDASAAPETHQPSAPADSNPSDDDAALNNHNNDNIDDDDDEEEEKTSINVDADDAEAATLPHVSGSIDKFLQYLSASPDPMPEVPSSTVETFSGMVEEVIAMYDSGKVRFGQGAEEDSSLIHAVTRISALTNAIRNLPSSSSSSSSTTGTGTGTGTGSHSKTASSLDRASRVLQRAMSFFEEEFRALLEDLSSSSINNKGGGEEHRDDDGGNNTNTSNTRRTLLTTNSAKATSTPKTKQSSSFNNNNNNNNNNSSSNKSNYCVLPEVDSGPGSEKADEFAGYSAEAISRMNRIAEVMILTGYETECCQVYSIARRNAFEQALNRHGFEKISIDDVQRMQWDALNGEIFTWTKVVAHCTTKLFPGERNICQAVFAGHHPTIFRGLFTNLARAVVIQLLAFAEAVAMTKRSAEKLFRFLDMYETLRDLLPAIDDDDDETTTTTTNTNTNGEEEDTPTPDYYSTHELKSEIAAAGGRLGEAAVGNFCDLENSIKSDTGKTPVPSGALHPLTSYTMNYLRYACEYKDTLEQVFLQHHQNLLMEGGGGGEEEHQILIEGEDINNCCSHNNHRSNKDNNNNITTAGGGGSSAGKKTPTPFSVELMRVMDLLDANLEAKSRLYRDPSLRYIFLMNNGRYIMQKIRGSAGLHELMGDTWRRNRSSDLRQYHKMFQRETWVRVLGILKDDGLMVNGKVSKVALKERFKTFNALFEEIHRTQSTWVVSDEQLQSELRVSISAIVIPAYRSFLGRFRHYLDSGRQSHKYIKFQPEDIEAAIEELFEGNPMSMARRRN